MVCCDVIGKDVERNGFPVPIVSIRFDVMVWAVEGSLPFSMAIP